MVSDDAFDPRHASAASAAVAPAPAAAPPLSTLAMESPFLASPPLAWARSTATGSQPPAPQRSPAMLPPPRSPAALPIAATQIQSRGAPPPPASYGANGQPAYGGPPAPAPYHDAPLASGPYGAPIQAPYGGPYPAPYLAPSAASYAPYAAPAPTSYAVAQMYAAPPALPYGAHSPAAYGHHQQPSADALIPYSDVLPPGPPPDLPLSAPMAEPGPFHFAHLVTVKLSADNYLLWRAQVLPLMRSHYLEGYVDGSLPCPPAMVPVPSSHGGSVMVPNPAHRRWTAQDQAILGAIQSSLTPSVAGMVVFAATSRDASS
nr:protein transport protein sec31-like [Aegilops tauschii subsp. strangulata]